MTIFRTPLVIIDTETTGLLSDPDASPWEIAAVLLDADGQEIDHIEIVGRPDPYREPMRRIIALGGIDPDQVLALPSIHEVIQSSDLGSWMARAYRAGARATAFNVAFDQPMMERVHFPILPDQGWAPCVMEAAKRAMGRAGALPWMAKYDDWKMPKLSEAADFYGVPQQQPAHRALADARTAGLIAVEIQRRAKAAS